MAMTNHERVGKALELLKAGLASFVDREMKTVYQDKATAQAALFMGEDRLLAKKPVAEWDAAGLLKLMWEAWNDVFRNTLGHAERTVRVVTRKGFLVTTRTVRSTRLRGC